MWNPEARDASPIVCTFMSSWKRPKMPPLPGRRGTRRSLWKRAAAGLDEVGGFSCGTITSVRIPLPHFFAWTLELELEPWVSLWSNHFGEESTRLGLGYMGLVVGKSRTVDEEPSSPSSLM